MTPEETIVEALFSAGAQGARRYTDRILEALAAAGYVIVPREPTDAMIQEAADVLDKSDRKGFTPAEWYRAMIGAFK